MKAIVCSRYSPLESVRLTETMKPIPRGNEVLVRVLATCVNFNTTIHITGRPLFARFKTGVLRPGIRIPGSDISGRVEAEGPGATLFRPGDEVIGELGECGYGAYAEYVCVPESALVPKPENLTHNQAAAVPQAGLVALQALRWDGNPREGQSVLVYGASGGIGTFAVQIAKAMGAEVTGVCGPANKELVRSIGADHVIDYTNEDFLKSGRKYDLIIATAGYRPIEDYVQALSPGGTYIVTGCTMRGRHAMAQIFEAAAKGPKLSKAMGIKIGVLTTRINREDLLLLKNLIEAGMVRPVIDRLYKLDRAGDALRYYAKGHARGKVVITID